MKTCAKCAVLLFIMCFAHNALSQLDTRCTIETSGAKGTCKLITDCPGAIALLQQQIIPQFCNGFVGTVPIICCTASSTSTPKPATKATTLTTRSTTIRPIRTSPRIEQLPITAVDKKPLLVGEKSLQKCKEYQEWAYIKHFSPTLGSESIEKILDCPLEVVTLIIGGTKAKEKEFPHMALVGYDSDEGPVYKCGGSLISERHILTAGHCLFDRETGTFAKYVLLGILNRNEQVNDRSRAQVLNVLESIKHPDYKPPSKYHDIAILKLDKDAVLSPYVRPACLSTKPRVANKFSVASGWGNTDYGGEVSEDLLKVTLEIFSNSECDQHYDRNRNLQNGIVETQLCAGSRNDSRDACQGDSGGPLQIIAGPGITCMYEIIGVTSFGKACGIGNVPGVYTKVASYIEWIESIVWPN